MAENTIQLVGDVVKVLADAQIKTWLFGGWAEELSGLRSVGPHRDIDLLYPAQNFERLDEFLQTHDSAQEIRPKRFIHKRAFQWQGIMVEIFLVRSEPTGLITNFFGIHRYSWPQDTFTHTRPLPSSECFLASHTALRCYRERHTEVEQAYRHNLAQRQP